MSFLSFVLLENWKNIGRFEKNISIIEIKHWDISIQISQCFFFIFVYLNTSLYVKSGNINDLHRQLIQWEIHIGFNLRCQGVDQKCAVALFLIHNVGASCCKQHEARDLHFFHLTYETLTCLLHLNILFYTISYHYLIKILKWNNFSNFNRNNIQLLF